MSQTRRRQLLVSTAALLFVPLALSQPPARIYRIGRVVHNRRQAMTHLLQALDQGLQAHGYVNGRNVQLDYRFTEGKFELLPGLMDELVRSAPDIILTGTNPETIAAKKATQTIPIVMTVGTGVVETGIVSSLARPGGNITGLTWDVGAEMVAKRLEFLKEVVPSMSRVAVLSDPRDREMPARDAIKEAAAKLRVNLSWIEISDDFTGVFGAVVRERADGLFAAGGPRMFGRRAELTELATMHRLPASYYDASFVDAGGLMSYAPNLPGLFRETAKYVDRILKGAKPGDLPVERPTRLELVINLKTARALSLTIPPSLLLRADRVIE